MIDIPSHSQATSQSKARLSQSNATLMEQLEICSVAKSLCPSLLSCLRVSNINSRLKGAVDRELGGNI